ELLMHVYNTLDPKKISKEPDRPWRNPFEIEKIVSVKDASPSEKRKVTKLVVANRDIKPGEFIGMYEGQYMLDVEHENLEPTNLLNAFEREYKLHESHSTAEEVITLGVDFLAEAKISQTKWLNSDGLNDHGTKRINSKIVIDGSKCRGMYGWASEINDFRSDPLGFKPTGKNKYDKNDEGRSANCGIYEVVVAKWPVYFLIVNRKIKCNEEVLLDYGENYWPYIKPKFDDEMLVSNYLNPLETHITTLWEYAIPNWINSFNFLPDTLVRMQDQIFNHFDGKDLSDEQFDSIQNLLGTIKETFDVVNIVLSSLEKSLDDHKIRQETRKKETWGCRRRGIAMPSRIMALYFQSKMDKFDYWIRCVKKLEEFCNKITSSAVKSEWDLSSVFESGEQKLKSKKIAVGLERNRPQSILHKPVVSTILKAEYRDEVAAVKKISQQTEVVDFKTYKTDQHQIQNAPPLINLPSALKIVRINLVPQPIQRLDEPVKPWPTISVPIQLNIPSPSLHVPEHSADDDVESDYSEIDDKVVFPVEFNRSEKKKDVMDDEEEIMEEGGVIPKEDTQILTPQQFMGKRRGDFSIEEPPKKRTFSSSVAEDTRMLDNISKVAYISQPIVGTLSDIFQSKFPPAISKNKLNRPNNHRCGTITSSDTSNFSNQKPKNLIAQSAFSNDSKFNEKSPQISLSQEHSELLTMDVDLTSKIQNGSSNSTKILDTSSIVPTTTPPPADSTSPAIFVPAPIVVNPTIAIQPTQSMLAKTTMPLIVSVSLNDTQIHSNYQTDSKNFNKPVSLQTNGPKESFTTIRQPIEKNVLSAYSLDIPLNDNILKSPAVNGFESREQPKYYEKGNSSSKPPQPVNTNRSSQPTSNVASKNSSFSNSWKSLPLPKYVNEGIYPLKIACEMPSNYIDLKICAALESTLLTMDRMRLLVNTTPYINGNNMIFTVEKVDWRDHDSMKKLVIQMFANEYENAVNVNPHNRVESNQIEVNPNRIESNQMEFNRMMSNQVETDYNNKDSFQESNSALTKLLMLDQQKNPIENPSKTQDQHKISNVVSNIAININQSNKNFVSANNSPGETSVSSNSTRNELIVSNVRQPSQQLVSPLLQTAIHSKQPDNSNAPSSLNNTLNDVPPSAENSKSQNILRKFSVSAASLGKLNDKSSFILASSSIPSELIAVDSPTKVQFADFSANKPTALLSPPLQPTLQQTERFLLHSPKVTKHDNSMLGGVTKPNSQITNASSLISSSANSISAAGVVNSGTSADVVGVSQDKNFGVNLSDSVSAAESGNASITPISTLVGAISAVVGATATTEETARELTAVKLTAATKTMTIDNNSKSDVIELSDSDDCKIISATIDNIAKRKKSKQKKRKSTNISDEVEIIGEIIHVPSDEEVLLVE
ncbi:hypothetical protein HK100_012746, partial [Physocladia obscura]